MHYEFNQFFRGAGLTNRGQLRDTNQDSYLIDSEAGLLLVADGMGGHQSGERASADAIRVMREQLTAETAPDGPLDRMDCASPGPDQMAGAPVSLSGSVAGERRVASAIARANDVINRLNREHGYGPREAMGTTIVGLYFQSHSPLEATIFHVGDSRFYRFRDGSLERITRDHSAYESWLEDGGNGPAPGQHILSQAIGPSASVFPAIQQQSFRPGDIILLCSDGLTNLVPDNDIETLLASIDTENLSGGCRRLVEAATSNGGTDNITVVLGAFSNDATTPNGR